MNIEAVEKMAGALSDQNRIRIFQEIAKRGKVTCKEAGELIALSQPTISHHIKLLVEAGLVIAEKDGRCLNLSVNTKKMTDFSHFLQKIERGE